MHSPIFFQRILPAGFIALSILLTSPTNAGTAQPAEYKVGDRLSGSSNEKAKPKNDAGTGYRETLWDALLPKDWDPYASMKNLKLDTLQDGDPRAIAAMKQVHEAWNKAPVETSLNGKKIRIPGFMVPLERVGVKVSEFLLVPYFGACIHVPPPPSNQIIYVSTDKPVEHSSMMEAVWVYGVLRTEQVETKMGQTGYRMKADLVEPYK